MAGRVDKKQKLIEVIKSEKSYTLTSDGKPILTPAKNKFQIPNDTLAAAAAEEWRGQKEKIKPDTMPLTQMLFIANDMVTKHRGKLEEEIIGFAATDLILYWAPEPPELVQAQKLHWQPILDWYSKNFHVPLVPAVGSMPVKQSDVLFMKVTDTLSSLNSYHFAAFHRMVGILGSYFLAYACLEGRLSPHQAWQAAILDETVQANKWGWDSLAKKRLDARRQDFMAAIDFLKLLSADGNA